MKAKASFTETLDCSNVNRFPRSIQPKQTTIVAEKKKKKRKVQCGKKNTIRGCLRLMIAL